MSVFGDLNTIIAKTLEKRRLREEACRRIALIPERQKKDRSIQDRLYVHLRKCTRIFAYIPLQDEVDLTPLYQRWEEEGKQVFFAPSSVSEGFYFKGEEYCLPVAGEPILTPGRIFSRDHMRIGRGGGWYDRLFALVKGYHAIGVAYDCQLVDTIPAISYDKCIHLIVTPSVRI